MKAGWATKPLGEVASVIMGQSPPGETYNTEGIGLPFFQGKAEFGDEFPSVVKWCTAPSRVAEPGDVLLSVRAPVGPTNIAEERCCIGRGLAAIRGRESLVSNRYLRHFLRRFEIDVARQGVGSTFTAINRGDIERLKIPLPAVPEQERIVSILDAAEELRRLRAQADRRTADLIPALFYHMFGDTEKRNERWEFARLNQLCEIRGGGTPSTKHREYWEGDIPWVSPKDMDAMTVEDAQDHITAEAITNSATNLIPSGSVVVVTRSGILKHTFPVAITMRPVAINQDLKALIPRMNLDPWFLAVQLKARSSAILNMVRTGATVQNLQTLFLSNFLLVCPPLALQRQFAARVQEIRALEARQAESRRRLDDLFQSLLHRAFRGEL